MIIINKNKNIIIDLIKELEKSVSGRVFFICQWGTGKMIDYELYNLCKYVLDKFGKIKELRVLVDSPGGSPHFAYRIINYFYKYTKNLEVLVADSAKSAATLFCLGASKIWMGEESELGPIDILSADPLDNTKTKSALDMFRSIDYLRLYTTTTLDWVINYLTSKDNFGMDKIHALREAKPLISHMITPLYKQIDPIELGGLRRKLSIAEEYGIRIMKRYGYRDLEEKDIYRIVYRLVWQYPAHEFVIDFKEAKEIGLKVEKLDEEKSTICQDIILKSQGCFGFYDEKEDGKKGKGGKNVS